MSFQTKENTSSVVNIVNKLLLYTGILVCFVYFTLKTEYRLLCYKSPSVTSLIYPIPLSIFSVLIASKLDNTLRTDTTDTTINPEPPSDNSVSLISILCRKSCYRTENDTSSTVMKTMIISNIVGLTLSVTMFACYTLLAMKSMYKLSDPNDAITFLDSKVFNCIVSTVTALCSFSLLTKFVSHIYESWKYLSVSDSDRNELKKSISSRTEDKELSHNSI